MCPQATGEQGAPICVGKNLFPKGVPMVEMADVAAILSLKEIIEKSGGGSLDKIFGAFFGVLRGGLIVVALSLLGTMTALTEEDAWVNAKTRSYLEFSVIQTIPYLPESVVNKIKIDFEGGLN